jgi:hypothetical protein
MGIFSKNKEKTVVAERSKPSFTQSLRSAFNKPKKLQVETPTKEWRASCKIRRYKSFIIKARDYSDAEEKLYQRIQEERYPYRYYWNLEEITLE